jgi:hypothetical protein
MHRMPSKGRGLPHPNRIIRNRALSGALIAITTGAARAADVISTMKSTGGAWSDPTHWTNAPAAATYPDNGNLAKSYDAVVNVLTNSPALLDVNATVENLTLSGGRLAPGTAGAARTLIINDTFTLGAANLQAAVNTRNLLFTSGAVSASVEGTLDVTGQLTQAAGIAYTQIAPGATGRITLQSTARFDVTSTFVLYALPSSDPGTSNSNGAFTNAGVINVATAGTLWNVPGWSVTNSGTVSIAGQLKAIDWNNTGTIDLTAPSAVAQVWRSTLAGSIRLAEGSQLILRTSYGADENNLAGPSITNAGVITIDGRVNVTQPTTIPGAVRFGTNAAALRLRADTTFTGPLTVDGESPTAIEPRLTVNANATLSGPTTLAASRIGGTGRVTAADFTFTSGEIGVANFVVPAGGTLTLPAGSNARRLSLGTTLRVEGSAQWAGGSVVSVFGTNRLEIAAGGTLHVITGPATVSHTNSTIFTPSDALLNQGLIHVDHASLETGWRATNAATILVTSGSLSMWNLSNNAGTIRVDAGLLRLAGVPASGNGTIELTNGGAADLGNFFGTLAAVRSQILAGRNPSPTGPTIRAVSDPPDPAQTVGYLQFAANGTWRGVPVFAGEVVAANTLVGDATLDGVVDFNDLVKLAQNYGVTGTKHWFHGDFTLDGSVDFNDLVLLAQTYGGSVPAIPLPATPATFNDDVAKAFSTVPEPAPTALLAVACGFAFFPRRKRAPNRRSSI